MAATRVEEAYSERDQTVNAKGEVTEIEIPYPQIVVHTAK